MSAVAIIGAQWGDEGKGKLIDVFSSEADMVVRYQGGANAGHTLKVKGQELVVHLIPSAIFHPQVKCLIASGVALDISALCEEIQSLQKIGLLKDQQLLISDSCSLLLPTHKQLDQAREDRAQGEKIGTTGKGIGPAYESRVTRKALLFSDLFESDSVILNKLERQLEEINFLLSSFYKKKTYSPQQLFENIKTYRDVLEKYRCKDMPFLISQYLKENKKIIFEGAQGSLLDLFHGTYPFVTSSSTMVGGALVGGGLGFQNFKKSMLVSKAYTTRVGSGPFPTECEGDIGLELRKKGQEFGATTGRKRRCGWLDLPLLKYAVRLNGSTSLALMKLDVLSGFSEIPVCTAYQRGSQTFDTVTSLLQDFGKVKAVYKTFKGWNQDLSSIKSKEELPPEAITYIDFIQKELETPIDVISVGPSRFQTLFLKKLF